MKLYRVTNKAYADNFAGRGASFEDGARWNSPGHPVIYFGLDMATALVEAANYHPSPRLIPASHCKAIYQLPDDVEVEHLELKNLANNWQEMPYPLCTQLMGDEFLKSNRALVLFLPSVAVGIEDYSMAVVNPLHPDITKLKLIETIQPVYSPRMFKGL
ncbi:RES family NAD+ phosphorylase [Thalassotalea sp. LPB0316]|uniref:RES family NAD+ phosphorylase n=1 Tax=Thalassotalea sp. LPB0316 TaxID=2769490 RepID=UPI0018693A22|nr:RES family NAD+ phosphorylase [Thalassotalea sp. LPB0316]QOL25234.1 RES family NAD+ phosphorylase [Thalassotalea sp. LPB0316]